MTRTFARERQYPNDATCNEGKEFLSDYTIPASLSRNSTQNRQLFVYLIHATLLTKENARQRGHAKNETSKARRAQPAPVIIFTTWLHFSSKTIKKSLNTFYKNPVQQSMVQFSPKVKLQATHQPAL